MANIAQGQLGHGVRSACVRKRDADSFEFNFVNDPEAAQPDTHFYFTIMLWKEGGKRLQLRVE